MNLLQAPHRRSTPDPVRLPLRWGLILCMAVLTACASTGTPPVAELSRARTLISQAESAGALRSAPVELMAARDKLGRAEAAVREERYALARQLAEAAEADALLAERRTRAEKAQSAVAELERGNATLRQEIERRRP
ncbi:MAG: DUF4398 domain-containing protein [Rubrivivax sp.]|nr:DUF4398 domain-containing protein [Rubrivivax sp.]